MEIIIFIAVVYTFFKTFSLQTQISDLKSQLKKSGAHIPASSTDEPSVSSGASVPPFIDRPIAASTPVETEPNPVMKWLSEDWILKLGVLMIVLGFGWFVSYAFIHNWIGPVGRIAFGFVLGACVTLFGDIRMKKYPAQGGTFLVLGAAIILITVSAARFIYGFFNPLAGLAIVFVTAAYITLASMRYNRESLAIVGVLVSAIAPLLSNSLVSDPVGRFLYIFVVSLAFIWVMFYTNWRSVGSTSVVMVLLYSVANGLFDQLGIVGDTVLGLGYLLSVILFITNVVSICKFKDKANPHDMVMAVVNGVLVMMWTLAHVTPELQSTMLALWMIVFAIGSFVVFKYSEKIEFFFMYALGAIVYLVTITTMELDGNALIFAYIFESGAIAIAGYVATSKIRIGETLSLLMLGPAFMTLQSFDSYRWQSGFWHEDFALILCMGIVLLGVGTYFFLSNKEDHPEEKSGVVVRPYTIMMIVGSIYLYGLLWVATMSVYDEAVAVMISLAVYTVIGIMSYFFGKRNDRVVYRNYGAVLLILVVARLLLVDVWEMELAVRIVTFIVIGILFVSTAFIANKNKSVTNQ